MEIEILGTDNDERRDNPICPYCGGKGYHATCWCYEHQRFECIVENNNEGGEHGSGTSNTK